MAYSIPCYARFQWINHPRVSHILSQCLKPPKVGRKGYDKALMFLWLVYRQVMRCTYRDLESMTGIDYSTFIKFRKRLIEKNWFASVFHALTAIFAPQLTRITALLDSSFVETYSKHDEPGSEYNGYKLKNGFKAHQMIDFRTRLPLAQIATPGARSDIVWGRMLIRSIPQKWKVAGVLADKAYDDGFFARDITRRWKGAKVGIPVRRIPEEVRGISTPEIRRNRRAKEAERCLAKRFLNKRTGIERYFSRKKCVFGLGEERTRGLENFEANCYLTSIAEILEWITTPQLWSVLFTKLYFELGE